MISRRRGKGAGILGSLCLVGGLVAGSASPVAAVGENMVSQWDLIAENTVVGSGVAQIEGLIYLSYTQLAVYDAVVAIEGGYERYGPAIDAADDANAEAAVAQAAHDTLAHYFPLSAGSLDTALAASLASIVDGADDISDGLDVGAEAAQQIIELNEDNDRPDGEPFNATSSFPTKDPAPGIWRLTPPTHTIPQIPWAGDVAPFVTASGDQYRPAPPPALTSATWVADFNEIKAMGGASSTLRTAEQARIARFYTANVPRQWNIMVREIAAADSLGLLETARLAAMINTVAADAGIAVMNAKYHFLFWRPVTAIDPGSVTNDGYGPVPGLTDGNPATVEEPGWRSLIGTPNHPEYPAAHGTITSAVAEVLTQYKGTSKIDVDIHGFEPTGAANNLDRVRHFDKANQLRADIINARLWGGVHYRNSTEIGVDLGRSVAKYDLKHAFEAVP